MGLRVTNTCDPNGGTAAVKFVQVLNCGGGWGFRATPNPSLGNVTISTIQLATQSTESSNQTKIYQIKVIDQYGNVRKQYSYTAGITNTNINLSNLAGGIYIIQAFNGTTWVSQQVLKQ